MAEIGLRYASSVILTRGDAARPEVFMVLRAPELRFFGGHWAFPGGAVDALDGPGDSRQAMLRCAARELFEETGILIDALSARLPAAQRGPLRESLLGGEQDAWRQAHEGRDLPADALGYVCRLTTPPFSPIRFATDFFHLHLPDGESPAVIPGELIEGRFFTADEALGRWQAGAMRVPPPMISLLELLAAHGLHAFPDAAARVARGCQAGRLHRAYFAPGLCVASLRTPTLPPAETTNTVIFGERLLYVIDPATPEPAEQVRLFDLLDELQAEGRRLGAILLTHHHTDHVGAVTAISRRYDLPVRAHPLTYARIGDDYRRGEPLDDGDRVPLGTAPDGSRDWHLQVLHTPGHAVDHLCFVDSRYRSAAVGDMVSTISTILIDPPEGHMRTYLEQLERLRDLDLSLLCPAHGVPNHRPRELLQYFLDHRREREERILDCLSGQARDLGALVAEVYQDVPQHAWAIAERSLLAGLVKLEEDGRCRQTTSGWRRV